MMECAICEAELSNDETYIIEGRGVGEPTCSNDEECGEYGLVEEDLDEKEDE